MTTQVADLANQLEALSLQLLDIRKCLKLGTAEPLAADMAAGKTTQAMTDAEIDGIKEAALERTKAFRNAQPQAVNAAAEKENSESSTWK